MSLLVKRYWSISRSAVFASIHCNVPNINNGLSSLSSPSRITIKSSLPSPLSLHQSAYFAAVPRARLGGTSTSTTGGRTTSTGAGQKKPKRRGHLTREEISARSAARRERMEKLKAQRARAREIRKLAVRYNKMEYIISEHIMRY